MKRTGLLWLLTLGLATASQAAGLIIVHDHDFWLPRPPGPVPTPRPPPVVWAPLEMTFTRLQAQVKDQVASTTVEQEFYNPNARQLEGTFLFPVPKGAHLDKFAMEINGRPAEAELLSADKARGIYENIVRQLRDPGLLEYAGRDLFKVRIFPIEPNSRKRVSFSYTQLLKSDGGLVLFAFPLGTEKHSAKPLKNVAVKVDLETRRPLKSLYSPTHKVEIKRHGERAATVGYEAGDTKPDQDFELYFSQEQSEVGMNLLAHKAEEDGYFLLLASPGEVKTGKSIPKDVTFVLDTSGSMAGSKLDQAKKALLFCVANLNDPDRFEILRFSTEVEPLFDRLAEASQENRARAEKFIKDLKPTGGTAIDEALGEALSLRPEKGDRPHVVIFLTDGRPTVGNTDDNQIVEHALKAAGAARVFCFGIGTDVNTHLLDKITEGTRAASQYVLPEEDIEVKVSGFFAKIKEPILANPKLRFPEGVRVTKLYPAALPDLFKGEQLVVAGRYSGAAVGEILLEGTVQGERRAFEFKADFPVQASAHEFIPRLWAARRVGYLLDEIRLHGENRELKDEVVELARKYGIVTPYTAYLILEDEQRRGLAQETRTFRELARDGRARQASEQYYLGLRNDVSGGVAVSGARSYGALKQAQTVQDAVVQSGSEVLRAAPASAPAALGRANGPAVAAAWASTPAAQAEEFARQGRFVNGRTFYLNDDRWVDAEVQKKPGARQVRLEFGSQDYFDFLERHPEASAWLALGRKVRFLLGDVVYEVHE
jgi:Ca-activated chloride channel homolog